MDANNAILSLERITKTYPGVRALDEVSVSFLEGEVHALVGENGAGKSTLIKCVSGVETPDSGKIYLHGKEFTSIHPLDTIEHGIVIPGAKLNPVTFSVRKHIPWQAPQRGSTV